MNMQLIVLATALIIHSYAWGASVHTWVDAHGVTHFSDTPPTDESQVEVIHMQDFDAASASGNDYYSISNQWQRLREERLSLERLHLEKKKARATTQPEVVYVDDTATAPGRRIFYPTVTTYGGSLGFDSRLYPHHPAYHRHRHHPIDGRAGPYDQRSHERRHARRGHDAQSTLGHRARRATRRGAHAARSGVGPVTFDTPGKHRR